MAKLEAVAAARERGLVLAKQGRFREALASLAIENIGQDDADGMNTRGMVLTALARLDEALECFERSLAVRPDFADAINNCGTVQARRGNFPAALRCYERSLALAPDQVHARYNLSTTLLVLGEWRRGFREFEVRWKLFPHEAVRRNRLAPVWLGECDVRGKTVLLHHEQGYGDAIQFSRYAPLVTRRAGRVIIAVPRALRTLMGTLGSGVEVVADGDPTPAHDYCCGLMSLPTVFGTTPETAPASASYLKADRATVDLWRKRLGAPSRVRIGLVWSGRRYPPINRPRDIPLETIRPLLGLDADIVCLQQGVTQQERELLTRHPNVSLHGEELNDFADTAALVENLDLVITVDTAIAHLAGALGKPVWLLNRFASCWRWLLKRTDSPWYPTMRLFRQPSLGDWESVAADVRSAAGELIGKASALRADSSVPELTAATRRSRSLRILLTWELGLNLGHLARLLPVASRLKERGHAVLIASRDPASAAHLLAPADISFVQAPYLAHGHPLPHRAAGYADILRAQGWGDFAALRGLTEGWNNLYRMFRPDLIVADYSPSAVLAAHITSRPVLLIGNGFELPPASSPLPPFPGFSWASAEQAAASEALVIEIANRVAEQMRGARLRSLRDIVAPVRALLATVPDLDHYGRRDGARYIGPLLQPLEGRSLEWPETGLPKKVFALVRPDTAHAAEILTALKSLQAAIVCVIPGFTDAQLASFRAPNVLFSSRLADLSMLTSSADLCVSYGAEGTMLSFLFAGVPQLISPYHVEAHMAARRIESLGLGVSLRAPQTVESIRETIQSALSREDLVANARRFSATHAAALQSAISGVVYEIESTAAAATNASNLKKTTIASA
jgi:UDP:flavonoid glycosyltransferase YjiC (YdhE family)